MSQVDFSRSQSEDTAVVDRLEYDPNRSARIALIKYPEGEAALSSAASQSKSSLVMMH